MTSSETLSRWPAAIPGVVDGSLTVCWEADLGISFHVAGERVRIEFILGLEHVQAIRDALAVDGAARVPGAQAAVPCQVGIRVIR
ncbi:MAG TPA: hypothetical protein VJT49_20485 [Amycolatopsis sp.]|uniref:hypothetical protein n=1 Tax=Amycolatopsis sp. TaxID=37632 RepID=UPI002B48D88F|nr:hypothetical protein [Amycolatopsis sp.]HKS47439.1 hypothetical protein [Amycolatopsis sp.]